MGLCLFNTVFVRFPRLIVILIVRMELAGALVRYDSLTLPWLSSEVVMVACSCDCDSLLLANPNLC